ncbi:MAG: CAP domain-containing protein [Bacteroidota bacterium]
MLIISISNGIAQSEKDSTAEVRASESLMLDEINEMRKNPYSYINDVNRYVSFYGHKDGKKWINSRYRSISNRLKSQLKVIGAGKKKKTKSDENVKYRKKPKKLRLVKSDPLIKERAKQYAIYMHKTQKHKHDKNRDYGELLSADHENITHNFIHLLIDQGFWNWIRFRPHRRALLRTDLSKVGIARAGYVDGNYTFVIKFRNEKK